MSQTKIVLERSNTSDANIEDCESQPNPGTDLECDVDTQLALLNECGHGQNLSTIMKLVNEGADIHYNNHQAFRIIFNLFYKELNCDLINYFLEHINLKTIDYADELLFSFDFRQDSDSDLAVLKILLDNGIQVSDMIIERFVWKGRPKFIKALIDSGIEIHRVSNAYFNKIKPYNPIAKMLLELDYNFYDQLINFIRT